MNTDAAFLEAIRNSPKDDTLRLVYADWLDEQGDTRAMYLRIETELRNTWTYENQRPDLVQEMVKLRPKLDMQWLAQVRRCTTPPPPLSIEKFFPFLKGQSKPTYLLHPRPGTAPRDASKIGGVFLWPKDEPWPTCEEHNDCPYVPALQLRKKDIPRITKFKGNSDLLQVLWCPNDHEPSYCVQPRIYWRRIQSVENPVDEHPDPEPLTEEDWYLPEPCVLLPEQVTEYPAMHDLEADDVNVITSHEDFLEATAQLKLDSRNLPSFPIGGEAYSSFFSVSGSTKVCGHPYWIQDPWYPNCTECGTTMEILLSISGYEEDHWGRWLPIEEQDILHADREMQKSVHCAHTWQFGDNGLLYLFICRNCPDWPIQSMMECC